jgi:hypothetical protein
VNPHDPRDQPTARSKSSPPPAGGVSTGAERRYALSAEIGSDSSSTVHLGKLLGPGGFERIVAVRRLRPRHAKDAGWVARVLDGARFAANVRHANVLPTLDVVTGDEVLVVTEYVAGESLAALLRAQRDGGAPTPPAVASGIVVGMLRGLQALHDGHAAHPGAGDRARAHHRVLSPENVRVGTDGVARLFDVDRGDDATPDPATGVDRADVFGASMVLWEALAGRPPPAQTAAGFEPPSRYQAGLDPEIDLLVSKGLTVPPGFGSAADMAVALEAALPPAAPSQIGAWVGSLASEALGERERLVAKFEQTGPAAPAPSIPRDPAPPQVEAGARGGRFRLDRRNVLAAAVAVAVVLTIVRAWHPGGHRPALVAAPVLTPPPAPVTSGAVAEDSVPAADTGAPQHDEPPRPPELRKARTPKPRRSAPPARDDVL